MPMTDENGLLGLSQSEAELRLQQYGPNSLPAAKNQASFKFLPINTRAPLSMCCWLPLWFPSLLAR